MHVFIITITIQLWRKINCVVIHLKMIVPTNTILESQYCRSHFGVREINVKSHIPPQRYTITYNTR